MRTIPTTILGLALILAATATRAQEPSPVATGKKVFVDQGCYGCHMVEKFGTPVGPDLSHVGAKYPKPYLEQWLRDPASQKPTAHMPKLQLSEVEVKALAAYLASLR
jgi:mono/diheme cytochrome c family protein